MTDSNEVDVDPRGTGKGASPESAEAHGEERYPPGDFTEEGGGAKPRPLQNALSFQNEVRKGAVVLLRSTEHPSRGIFSP